MDQDQLQALRAALISQKEEIESLSRAGHDATGTVTLDQSKVGRLSRMDALQAQQMAQETARRRQIQLQKIDSALRRIDAGDYGVCFLCGDEINPARLEIDPACTRCTACMDQ